tara:strand:- start:10441 stop:10803 length:363 start_codon:yes stop_codon:yes gene_type:complete
MSETRKIIAEVQALNRIIWAKENGRMHHVDANKLIAEFMGWDIQNQTTIPTNIHLSNLEFDNGEVMELKYHTDWNWLMPVINKCYQEYMSKHIAEVVMTCDISKAYQVVVEFINEYNSKG